MNNAATSFPKPKSVEQAVMTFLSRPPATYERASTSGAHVNAVDEVRCSLSELLNAPTQNDVFFFSSATHALNQAILGLAWQAGDEVITTVVEHNSVLRPLKKIEALGVVVHYVECDEFGRVDSCLLLNKLNKRTKLVVISHVSNVTGAVQDVEKIGASLAHHNALFLVDASQSLGLYPVNIKSMGVDMLAFTGHKFLFGLQGIGGLYVRPELALDPLLVGGTGVKSEELTQPIERPWCFQAGTPNMPGIVSLDAGVKFINQNNNMLACVKEKSRALMDAIHEVGAVCHSPEGSTVVSFSVCQDESLDDIACMLSESFGITSRIGLHCAPLIHKYIGADSGVIRLSPSVFSSDSEVSLVADAIKSACSTVCV